MCPTRPHRMLPGKSSSQSGLMDQRGAPGLNLHTQSVEELWEIRVGGLEEDPVGGLGAKNLTPTRGGGGVSAKCEVMGFCLKLATSKKGGGLPLLRATEIFQNAPRGVTVDVHKCVFAHFLGMQKEIRGSLASKVTDLCTVTRGCDNNQKKKTRSVQYAL